jgi:hypothetical protein
MAWKLLLATLAAAILAVPAALAGDTPGDGTLSVKRGRAAITIKFRSRSSVIGRINGTLSVMDATPLDDVIPRLIGCKVHHPPFGNRYWCTGRNISFRILDGRYKVTLKGTGIFLSAVGQGTVVIDGRGDLGVNDGVYSLNDDPYQSLPDTPQTLRLEAPPPQPGG